MFGWLVCTTYAAHTRKAYCTGHACQYLLIKDFRFEWVCPRETHCFNHLSHKALLASQLLHYGNGDLGNPHSRETNVQTHINVTGGKARWRIMHTCTKYMHMYNNTCSHTYVYRLARSNPSHSLVSSNNLFALFQNTWHQLQQTEKHRHVNSNH
jgi:hypothetical protein